MTSTKSVCLGVAVALIVFALPCPAAAQQFPRYQFIDIPTLGGPGPSCKGCFVNEAFQWHNGVLTNLGALPGTNASHATSINAVGWATGGSSTPTFDTLTESFGEHAVLWKNGQIIDLGTLGTGLESAGLYVNNAGQVIGFTTFDQMPDPNSFKGATLHAFIWDKGVMRDLGTLGGSDSTRAGGCKVTVPSFFILPVNLFHTLDSPKGVGACGYVS